MTSLCHSLQPSTKHERCSDVDQEEELFLSAVVLNELPYPPWPSSDRLCSSSLRCSCLCGLTLGFKESILGLCPGKNYKNWGRWGPSVAEVRDKQERSLLHVQNVSFFLWQLHNSQCNYAAGWGVRERLKKGNTMECRRGKEGEKNIQEKKTLSTETTDLKLTT